MRKVVAILIALGFVIGVSGVAFAGGPDGVCDYSHAKQTASDKATIHKPIAKKSEPQTLTDRLLLAQEKSASKPSTGEKK